jgi:hypothetical protein
MNTMRLWFAVLGAGLLMAGTLMAAPLFDEAVPTLTLKDGTVLRDAQIKGYLTKVVMVKYREGARTVPYGLFPDEYQTKLVARRPAPLRAPKPAKPTTVASKTETPVNQGADLRFGCSFSVVAVTDAAITIEIHNESKVDAKMSPEMFVARAYSGEMLPGTQWVGLNNEGRVSVILKRQQLIAPGDVATLQLMVAPTPHESGIQTVQWKD